MFVGSHDCHISRKGLLDIIHHTGTYVSRLPTMGGPCNYWGLAWRESERACRPNQCRVAYHQYRHNHHHLSNSTSQQPLTVMSYGSA
jgi:hypothetical protein